MATVYEGSDKFNTNDESSLDEELVLIPMSRSDVRVALQALLDAPYIGLGRPDVLTNAIGSIQNGAIAGGWDDEANTRQVWSKHVWTQWGYEREEEVDQTTTSATSD